MADRTRTDKEKETLVRFNLRLVVGHVTPGGNVALNSLWEQTKNVLDLLNIDHSIKPPL